MLYDKQVDWGDGVTNILMEKVDIQGEYFADDHVDKLLEGDQSWVMTTVQFFHQINGDILTRDEVDLGCEPDDIEAISEHLEFSEMNIDDSIGLYLKEMSRVPLLRLSEELELAERILAGRTAQVELSRPNTTLTVLQRNIIQQRVESGLTAREHLIKANTRLVVSIAKKYTGRGVAFLD